MAKRTYTSSVLAAKKVLSTLVKHWEEDVACRKYHGSSTLRETLCGHGVTVVAAWNLSVKEKRDL